MNLGGSLSQVATQTDNGYQQFLGQIDFNTSFFNGQNISIGFNQELESFNAALLQEQLRLNNIFLSHNISTNKGLGWYTQLRHTPMSDGNNRNLLFTSLYARILKSPMIKTGVNYQFLSFDTSRPEVYFSPETYHAHELFAELKGGKKKFTYGALVAGGVQKIESDPYTSLFRCQVELSYTLNEYWKVKGFGAYSNNATETAAGFTFTQLGISLSRTFERKNSYRP